MLAHHTAVVRSTTLRLREIVLAVVPDARESIDLPDHLLAYGWTERMRDLIVAVAPHTAHVNLQLADGAVLPDPHGIVEGTGKRIRHVKCFGIEDADRPAVRALISEQVKARPRPVPGS